MHSIYRRKDKEITLSQLNTGDYCDIWRNQGWRDARVLLKQPNGDALIEYSMPRGSTALFLETGNKGRSVSYFSLNWTWLQDLVFEGIDWEGSPQRGRDPGDIETLYAIRAIKRYKLIPGSVIMATNIVTGKRDLVDITPDMIKFKHIPYIDIQRWK